MKLKERLCDWKCWAALVIFLLLAIVPIFTGCAQAYHPLEGLCYSDKTGTYICLEQKKSSEIPEYDRGKNCLSYTQNEEEWRWCMDSDNDHIYDPLWKIRKKFHEKLEQEQKLKQIDLIRNIA